MFLFSKLLDKPAILGAICFRFGFNILLPGDKLLCELINVPFETRDRLNLRPSFCYLKSGLPARPLLVSIYTSSKARVLPSPFSTRRAAMLRSPTRPLRLQLPFRLTIIFRGINPMLIMIDQIKPRHHMQEYSTIPALPTRHTLHILCHRTDPYSRCPFFTLSVISRISISSSRRFSVKP